MKALLTGWFVAAIFLPFVAGAESAEAASENIVYSFCNASNCSHGSTDGTFPLAGLIEKKGKLYATTYAGDGMETYCNVGGGSYGCGTVFSIDLATGAETILHAFDGRDGEHPSAGLIDVNGTFYGTTLFGGRGSCPTGCGTIFSIDPATGRHKLLHNFERSKAEYPGRLTDVKGTLYGTTEAGGGRGSQCNEDGCGTVFSFDLSSGKEATVHQLNHNTGGGTLAGVLNVDGELYGATPIGGTHYYGTVFSLDPATRSISTLYNFEGPDAPSDLARLIDVNGTFYGTTTGTPDHCCGSVFSIDPNTGTVTVLHSFCGQSCSDGADPVAGLINVGDVLYGTTQFGGTGTCMSRGAGGGCGVVFSFDLSTNTYTVVYSFQHNGTDGRRPWTPLLDVKGTLYGTTLLGGGGACGGPGCGTVFSISP